MNDKLKEQVFSALGAASMAWEKTPTGVFDSVRAKNIGETLIKEIDENYTGNGRTSDGYHTFDDLYEHRLALTVALVRSHFDIAWRSRDHHPDDAKMFDGFFIVGFNLPGIGQVSYHYKLEHWTLFNNVAILKHAPKWDGHTPEDVVKRLGKWKPNEQA